MAIGKALGVSNFTAHQDLVAYRDQLLATGFQDAALRQDAALGRLDRLIALHMKKAGNKGSADLVLKALEREARIVGYDKKQTGISQERVAAALRGLRDDLLREFPDKADQQRIFNVLRRRFGPVASGPAAIETTAVPAAGVGVDHELSTDH